MKIPIIFFFLFFPAILFAQSIDFDMPSCYALQYTFSISKGSKLDTIAIGRVDTTGKATFTLPVEYASYRGVGHLSIKFCNENINIILNKEERISISEISDSQDVQFSNSAENIFLHKMLDKQREIIEEYNRQGVSTLPTYSTFLVGQKYESFLQKVKQSPHYAGRMVELLNCLTGLGNKLGMSQEELIEEQRNFITEELNFKDLYTSGFWQLTFDTWYQAATIGKEEMVGDSILLSESRKMLDKVDDVPIRRELTQTLIRQFSKYGKDYLLSGLGTEYLTIPLNGKPAPKLIVEGDSIDIRSSLLFFYDSDCGLCHNEMHQLIDKYELLSNAHNQIDVIAISADTDADSFNYTAQKMPWGVKLFNKKGFEGENFINYGVVGTPTLILIDKEGFVRGRYARLSEFLQD